MTYGLDYREIYYQGIYNFHTFTVEQACVDITNRMADLDEDKEDGLVDDFTYQKEFRALEDARVYIGGEMIERYLTENGFRQNEDKRFFTSDLSWIAPLDIESIDASIKRVQEAVADLDEKTKGFSVTG